MPFVLVIVGIENSDGWIASSRSVTSGTAPGALQSTVRRSTGLPWIDRGTAIRSSRSPVGCLSFSSWMDQRTMIGPSRSPAIQIREPCDRPNGIPRDSHHSPRHEIGGPCDPPNGTLRSAQRYSAIRSTVLCDPPNGIPGRHSGERAARSPEPPTGIRTVRDGVARAIARADHPPSRESLYPSFDTERFLLGGVGRSGTLPPLHR
jgi:hypothetical protein